MTTTTFLSNHFLIAMPTLTDPYFAQGVTYICEHNANGAIGIVINHPLGINLSEVLSQLEITAVKSEINELPVLCGGPVHPERGFVIHTPCGKWRSSLEMSKEVSVTTSRDILQAIAQNEGPEEMIVSLGYSNWNAGQLEQEIIDNFWLFCPADTNVLFRLPFEKRWQAALDLLGINISQLSSDIGHA